MFLCYIIYITIRLHLLHIVLYSMQSEVGLYRDNGLIYLENANGPLISNIKKALCRIFKWNQLIISMEQKGYTVNFLDVTLSADGSHKPYKKPNHNFNLFLL